MTAAFARLPVDERGGLAARSEAGPSSGGSAPPAAPLPTDSAQDAVWLTDSDGQLLHWNQTAERVFGWRPEEVFERNVLEIVFEGAARDEARRLLAAASTTRACSGEMWVQRRDGSSFLAQVSFAPLQDGADGVVAIAWVTRDISQLRAAQDDQRRMNAVLQAQLDASPDGVLVFMGERVVTVNARFRELFQPREELLGATTRDVLRVFADLLDEPTRQRIIDDNQATGPVADLEFITRTGRTIRRSLRPILGPNGETGRVSFYREVTEERRAQAREQLQARLTSALAQLRNLALEAADLETLERQALPLIQRTLAAEAVDVARTGPDGTPPLRGLPGAGCGEPAVVALIPGRETAYGVLRVFVAVPRAFSVPEVNFLDACAAMFAATIERASVEAALRDSERRWRELVARIPDGIAVVADGRYVLVNDALVRILGHRSQQTLVGRPFAEVMGVENMQRLEARQQQLRTHQGPLEPAEYVLRRPDGTTCTIEAVAMALEHEGRPAALSIVRDVTERRQLQARLMLADRMASVGTLAAGVAHELNNPLAYVTGNLNFAIGELGGACEGCHAGERARELREALTEAREGADRMRHIIRDLKGFSRVDDQLRAPVDVRRGVETAINMAFNEVKQRARLEKGLEPVPPVLADDGRIAQVVLNLLVNAAHAIPEGQADRHEIRVATGVRDDGRVTVTVADDGAGIAPEHLPRIFDPFFTTKPLGVGTGLGLSVCHNIVRSLGGTIEVSSIVGRGSTFRIVLPPAHPTATERRATSELPLPRAGRILVIDDEPMILALFRRTFAPKHQVVLSSGAAEALSRLAAGERFDLIFCDVLMPGITGAELFERMRAEYPEQAAVTVFMTGGAFTPATVEFLEQLPNQRIDKPFGPEVLETVVAARLASAAASGSPPAG